MPSLLPPLRFAPILRPTMWGGDYLAPWLTGQMIADPIGEAWILSDEGDHLSVVADGPFSGRTLRELLQTHGLNLLGSATSRFPLLLKFLDARRNLSVQVHPNDEQASRYHAGASGKTEAWVILHAEPGSRIYAGLKPGVEAATLRASLVNGGIVDLLRSFEPKPGDCVFLPAGILHAVGSGIRLFEIQQSCDITFRLFDWNRIDPTTGKPRMLHVEEALECVDFENRGTAGLVEFANAREPLLVDCAHFRMWRRQGAGTWTIGARGECRILVGISGEATIQTAAGDCIVRPGQAWLLPAELGAVFVEANASAQLLECGLGSGC